MPHTKNALIRYQALDNCFSNTARKFYIADLLNYCNSALIAYDSSSDGIRKRQLFEDIKFMESVQGWNIPLERFRDGKKVFYRYASPEFSIKNEPINAVEAVQVKAALLVFQRIKGMPQFKWMQTLVLKLEKDFQLKSTKRKCIAFDSNDYLKGVEYIGALFHAILYKRVLKIQYQSFGSAEVKNWTLHPHYLKQFNNRWFLLGKNPDFETVSNLALDRIVSFKEVDLPFVDTDIDFEMYFEDILGVTVPLEAELTKITLRASPRLAPYIQTKPIHGSQKQVSEGAEGCVFSIEVLPNYELEKHLLSFGEALEVLEPLFFREQLRKKIATLARMYSNNSIT
jgi:predicted DNA-binding transcriptional regulator YafY